MLNKKKRVILPNHDIYKLFGNVVCSATHVFATREELHMAMPNDLQLPCFKWIVLTY